MLSIIICQDQPFFNTKFLKMAKQLKSQKFRKPLKIILIGTIVILFVAIVFYAASVFFPCLYQMPYLQNCDKYCCQFECAANITDVSNDPGCKLLDQQPYYSATEYTMYVGAAGIFFTGTMLVCCSCTTKVVMKGENGEEVVEEEDGEET